MDELGLTPGRILARAGYRPGPRTVCTSIPRAGKGLVQRLLCRHPALRRVLGRTLGEAGADDAGAFTRQLRRMTPGQVLPTHLRYSSTAASALRAQGVRHVVVVRDPRNAAISNARFLLTHPRHPLHGVFAAAATEAECIALALRGVPEQGFLGIGARIDESIGWLDSGALVLRFEDLVADGQTPATAGQRRQALQELFGFLELALPETFLQSLLAELSSGAERAAAMGRSCDWRRQFTPGLHALYRQVAGASHQQYGYSAHD